MTVAEPIPVNRWQDVDFAASVERVCQERQVELAHDLAQFDARQRLREQNGWGTVAFVGPGRSGKDTCAQVLSKYAQLTYGGSVSLSMNPYIAHALGLPAAESWQRRHEHHEFWRQWMDAFRERQGHQTPTRMLLGLSDIAVGIWAWSELWAAWRSATITHVVWVQRPGFDFKRLTQGFGIQDVRKLGGYIILNEGTEQLPLQMRQLALQLDLAPRS